MAKGELWYDHGSNPACGTFDLNMLRRRNPSLKASYAAGDPCPNCGKPFIRDPFPVHHEDASHEDFYTDVIDLKRVYKYCPMCHVKIDKAKVFIIKGESQATSPPQPTPPITVRQDNHKEPVTFEDILRYTV